MTIPELASNESTVAVFDSPAKAEAAIQALRASGTTSDEISVVRRHFDPDRKTVEELKVGDDSLHDAAIGGAVGGVAGMAGAATLISATGVGLILMTGPLVALTGAIVGAFLGAMRGWGIHETNIKHYERLVDEGNILVVVSGDPPEVEKADQLLRKTGAVEVRMHVKAADESGEIDDRPNRAP